LVEESLFGGSSMLKIEIVSYHVSALECLFVCYNCNWFGLVCIVISHWDKNSTGLEMKI